MNTYDRLIGTWKVSGGTTGTITYRWLEGRNFLIQDIAMDSETGPVLGMEVIGREMPFGADKPGDDVKSRYYGSGGETYDYVYELDGDTLTIWGGEKGSPAYYQGTFSADGDTLTGAWHYPGGGGYDSVSVRIP
ncbi:hypothetical protein AB0K48_16655 [Nonomuraea sp. NPDC055795]